MRQLLIGLLLAGSAAIGTADPLPTLNPGAWPALDTPFRALPQVEARIDALLRRMTLEEKVGQMVQAEIRFASPADVRDFHLGSVLSGGGSWPDGNPLSSPEDWRRLTGEYHNASLETRLSIPLLWGVDAVHGHNNVVGATLFPHNIGLGAANNARLMYEIGRATALETAATGIDWTFAPTLAVARDDRWGRTYESYSEDPATVARMGTAIARGLHGAQEPDNSVTGSLITTAKHFIGDGGTLAGTDRGDTLTNESTLRTRHASAYYATLNAGTQTVMASFSSWRGAKLHGGSYLLTTILRERMGFDGLVLGDWNGHEVIDGCKIRSCATAINAGVDMVMVPEHWRSFIYNTLEDVVTGAISAARVDEAVRRILRVKIRAGLFEKDLDKLPSASVVGSPEHRALAREAARQSLVLLKNEPPIPDQRIKHAPTSVREPVLPLRANQTILVAGNGADDLARQTGGWTVTWQGTDNPRVHYRGATSILEGISETVSRIGGTVVTDTKFRKSATPDVAVIVFGEEPYTEFFGDREHLEYNKYDRKSWRLLKRLHRKGIPTVAVFLSGRPMVVSQELLHADAFIAAWLPGSEGGAIADALFATDDFNFAGRLSFSWPKDAEQAAPNFDDDVYLPLFPVGYGLRYAANN
ncbi:MAG: glycoside hydrolase family 3 protein [Pseudomonadota bacterium]